MMTQKSGIKRLPRGLSKSDPRIYHAAQSEADAIANVSACEKKLDKLNLLLRRAAYHDDLLTAEKALEEGADPNSQNLLREGPMVTVCQKGSPEMLRLFLEHGAKLSADKFGAPALIHAIRNGRVDLVKMMIEAGADVNERENLALHPPLHFAATRSIEIVKLLLAAGADPREVDAGGADALSYAKEMHQEFGGGKPAIFKVLQEGLRKWKGKPLPKKPRRKLPSKTKQLADNYIENDPGGP